MTDMRERVKAALQNKRSELIAKPLAQILDDLADAAIAEAFKWMPIETAPKDGRLIVSYHRPFPIAVWYSSTMQGWVDGSLDMYDEYIVYSPTHWMPIESYPELDNVCEPRE